MQTATPLGAVLRRDGAIIIVALLVVSALAWAYVVYLAWDMRQGMSSAAMAMAASPARAWGAVDFALMYLMWAGMMVAMMAPSTTARAQRGQNWLNNGQTRTFFGSTQPDNTFLGALKPLGMGRHPARGLPSSPFPPG